jgi:hypothetical protein
MLPDPLVLPALWSPTISVTSTGTAANFSIRDISPGGSSRVNPYYGFAANSTASLTISHSVSNENKAAGVSTDRSLIRLDVSRPNAQGVQVGAFAYLVVGTPHSADFTLAELQSFVGALFATLCGTQASLAAGNFIYDHTTSSTLARILSGEP